jgi:hypothetical protein
MATPHHLAPSSAPTMTQAVLFFRRLPFCIKNDYCGIIQNSAEKGVITKKNLPWRYRAPF